MLGTLPPGKSSGYGRRPVGATCTSSAPRHRQDALLRHLILSDLSAGAGFALIDPHGDIATEIADSIPKDQTGRALYFDPADLSHPIGFNPVEGVPIDQRALRASHIVATFEHIWRASWGPRMSYILENAIRLLLDAPGATLLGLPRLLTIRLPCPASQNLRRSGHPPLLGSGIRELRQAISEEAISPIFNKIGALISSPAIRNIIGQPKSTIDIARIMDSGRMLVVNLSKGRIGRGADASSRRISHDRHRASRRGQGGYSGGKPPPFHAICG